MSATVQISKPSTPRVRTSQHALWLVGLYLLATGVYVALGNLRDVPVLNPDEFFYGHLAQGLANGTGFDWRGEPVRLYALLYVLLIAPAWVVGSAVSAFTIAKAISAALLCLVCVPVFLLTRVLLGPRLALLAAVLSLVGTWMVTATMLLTENASLPLATAALCATVMALRAPASRWIWWALGFAVLAAFARVQVASLVVVILLALGADVLRHRATWRERGREHRAALIVFGVLTAGIAVLGFAGSSLLTGSIYASTSGFAVFSGGNVSSTLRELIALVAMVGFIPVALLVPLAGTRAAWRDDVVGPLLAVLVAVTLVFVAQAGWFMHGLGYAWAIQRYVEYVIPLALIGTLVAATRWRERPRWSWTVPLVVAPVLLLGGKLVWGDELGAFAAGRAARAAGLSAWIGVAVGMAALGSLGLWLVRREGRRAGPDRAAFAIGGLLLVVLLAQSAVAWIWPIQLDRSWRQGFPSDLAWLDKAARGPVSRLVITQSHPRWPTVEFFNRDVDRVYALAAASKDRLQGKTCAWTISPTGEAMFDPDCGPAPTRFLLDDPAARLTFAGQETVARTPGAGRIVEVPGAPSVANVDSLLVLPCDDRTLLDPNGKALGYGDRVCRSLMSGYFWLDAPATLVLGIRGGQRSHAARSGGRTWAVPAGKVTTLRIPVRAGGAQLELRFDGFELPLGYPDVVSARLEEGGASRSIL